VPNPCGCGTPPVTHRPGSAIPLLRHPDGLMLTQPSGRARIEVFDAAVVAAELERLADVHSGKERDLRLALSRRSRPPCRRGGPRGAAVIKDRHGGVALSGCALCITSHPRPVTSSRPSALSRAEPVGGRAHGGGRHRRLRPRRAGAGLRTSISCSAALQADRWANRRPAIPLLLGDMG